MALEDPGKVKFAFKTAGQSNFSDPHGPGSQKRFGAAETAFQQELSGRQSRELLEEPAEVDVGERHGGGFLFKGPRFFGRFREFVPQLSQLSAVECADSGGECRLFPELDKQLFQKQNRTGMTGCSGCFQKRKKMKHRLKKALRIVNRKKEVPVPEFEEALPEIAIHPRTAETDVRLVPDRSFRGSIVELHAWPCDEHMRSIDTFHRRVVDPCPDFAVIMKLDPVIAFKQTLPCLARRIFRIAVIDKNQIVEIVHVVNPCCMGENVIRESGKSKVFRGDFSRKRA